MYMAHFCWQADDVLGTLVKEVPPGFYSNLDDFAASLAKDANFKPFGELLHSYSVFKGMYFTCLNLGRVWDSDFKESPE